MTGNKRVLVTGGGSGLGAALAQACAQRGWRVAVSDLSLPRARQVCDALPNASDCLALELNVLDLAACERARDELARHWDGVDIVINNAGIGSAGSVVATPMEEWQRVLEANLYGVVRGCRTFLPQMMARRSGHIVNIASFAALANAPGMAAYNVSKAGVVALSESLRLEVADHGIGVTVVCPSFFPTNLPDSMTAQSAEVKNLVSTLMATSGLTADDVARQTLAAVDQRRFLVIAPRSMRWLHRMKRWAPGWFFRAVHRRTRGMLPPELR